MKKVTDWPSFGPKMKVLSEWRFVSLSHPRFHWLLNTERGLQAPTMHKYNCPNYYEGDEDGDIVSSKHRPGVTVARSGLISRRGYVRIIREDISVPERDVMVSELKLLAS